MSLNSLENTVRDLIEGKKSEMIPQRHGRKDVDYSKYDDPDSKPVALNTPMDKIRALLAKNKARATSKDSRNKRVDMIYQGKAKDKTGKETNYDLIIYFRFWTEFDQKLLIMGEMEYMVFSGKKRLYSGKESRMINEYENPKAVEYAKDFIKNSTQKFTEEARKKVDAFEKRQSGKQVKEDWTEEDIDFSIL